MMDTMDTANLTNTTAMMARTTQSQKKRKLIDALDTPERALKKRLTIHAFATPVAATLTTINAYNKVDKLTVCTDRPITIGRDSHSCDYVVVDTAKVVSTRHCTVHAVRSDAGKISIVCQDFSKNGVLLNGKKILHSSFFLMHGDELRIPQSQTFVCEHTARVSSQLSGSIPSSLYLGPQTIGDFHLLPHALGRGAFSSVFLAINTRMQCQVACKRLISKSRQELHTVMKEVQLLKQFHHPNLNQVFHYEVSGEYIHIFLELATGGDLFSYIDRHRTLGEGETRWISYQLMKGLEYLHEREVSHRGKELITPLYVANGDIPDIKPENILLATPGSYPRVLIADFGLARDQAWQATAHIVGTISYLPPEAIQALARKDAMYVGPPADCWSLGVVIYVMLSGLHPFDYYRPYSERATPYEYDNSGRCYTPRNSDDLVGRRIVQKTLCFDDARWKKLPEAQHLTEGLLVREPANRLGIKDALSHPWIRNSIQKLEKYNETLLVDWNKGKN